MFDIGPLEMVALGVIAVMVFGEKLPRAIADGVRLLRQVRRFAQDAREDIRREIGPELADVDLSDLNPRTLVRKHILDDDLGLDEYRLRPEEIDHADGARPVQPAGEPVRPGERPPYDADAT